MKQRKGLEFDPYCAECDHMWEVDQMGRCKYCGGKSMIVPVVKPKPLREESDKKGMLIVVTYAFIKCYEARVKCINHDDDLAGMNIVAVIDGELHPDDDCEWCRQLRERCRSRREA